MSSVRKANRQYQRWHKYFRKYEPWHLATPGMERAYNHWVRARYVRIWRENEKRT
jgi:hypothetical protein